MYVHNYTYVHTYIHILLFVYSRCFCFCLDAFLSLFRLPGASQQIYAICLAIYVPYTIYVYDNWCPHAIFSAFALQTVSDSAGARGGEGRGGAVKALALSLMNWNEWAAGVRLGTTTTTTTRKHINVHAYACIHTHTRTQTLPRCRLKNLLAALPAAQHSRRAVGSAALLWWVYCAGCLEVWQQPQQQRRCDVVGDKDSEIHVILFLPKTTHNKDVNKTHKHTHPEHTPTHTRTASLTNEI